MFVYTSDIPNGIYVKLNKYGNKVLRVNTKPFKNSLPENARKDCIYMAGDNNIILDKEEYEHYYSLISKYKLSKIIKEYPEVKGRPQIQKLIYISLYSDTIEGLSYRINNNIIHLADKLKGNESDVVLKTGTDLPNSVYNSLIEKYGIHKKEVEIKSKSENKVSDDVRVTSDDITKNKCIEDTNQEIEESIPIEPPKGEDAAKAGELLFASQDMALEHIEDNKYDVDAEPEILLLYNTMFEEGYNLNTDEPCDYLELDTNSLLILQKDTEILKVKEDKVEDLFALGSLKDIATFIKGVNLEDYFETKLEEVTEESKPEYIICDLAINLVYDINLNILDDIEIPSVVDPKVVTIVVLDKTNRLCYPISDETDIDVVANECKQGNLENISIGIEY